MKKILIYALLVAFSTGSLIAMAPDPPRRGDANPDEGGPPPGGGGGFGGGGGGGGFGGGGGGFGGGGGGFGGGGGGGLGALLAAGISEALGYLSGDDGDTPADPTTDTPSYDSNAFKASIQAITAKKSLTAEEKEEQILALVEAQVRAFPSLADQIVRDAISASVASNELIAKIVKRVGIAAPEQLLKAAKAAVAQVPESLAAVNAVLVELGVTDGDRNPLNFPDGGTLNVTGGPATGGALGVTFLQLIIVPAATNN